MGIVAADDWTGDLPPRVRDALLARMTMENVAAEAEVHVPGAMARGMIRVEEGHLRLASPRRDGGRSLLAILAPGSCLGEGALLVDRPLNNSATALGPVRLSRLSRHDFLTLYHEHREIADALCRKFGRAIARQAQDRARRAEQRIGARVAATLLDLCHSGGPAGPQGITLPLPLTQLDLAEHLDVTRQSVQIEVAALQRAGIVRREGGCWLVTDARRLASLANPG